MRPEPAQIANDAFVVHMEFLGGIGLIGIPHCRSREITESNQAG
jgi:hypothetical protein